MALFAVGIHWPQERSTHARISSDAGKLGPLAILYLGTIVPRSAPTCFIQNKSFIWCQLYSPIFQSAWLDLEEFYNVLY
jgi:hypothetical protein